MTAKGKRISIECDCCGRIYDRAHATSNGLEIYKSNAKYKVLIPGIKSREELVCTPKNKLPNVKCDCGGFIDFDETFECEDTRDIVFLEKLDDLGKAILHKYSNKVKTSFNSSYIYEDEDYEDYYNTFNAYCSDYATAREIIQKCANAYAALDTESSITINQSIDRCSSQYKITLALDDEVGYIKYLDILITEFEKEDKE